MTNTTKANESAITIEQVIAFLGLKDISCPVNDAGLTVDVPVISIVTANPSMLRFAALAGFMGKLGNVSKGGLAAKLNRKATDKDLFEARTKIVKDAWLAGSWNLSGSGPRDSVTGEMRAAFILKQVSLGRTVEQAEAKIKDTVTQAFGKDEKATFPRFLDACATLKAKATPDGDYDSIRKDLEEKAMAAVEAERVRQAEAAEALKDMDLSDLF